ncbi:hypothetical protein EVAR_51288_1 [Eumeta japonica]|uniref:Uncharacterized protein n=1 Tax=Eumeta variegata TaxID=151549 RepID=A0A4C1XV69_EUMVA|nr:hypothetical protein EVAR_51288_1 [Eumeta japonica]
MVTTNKRPRTGAVYTVRPLIGVLITCGSDHRSFSGPSRFSIVEFLRSGPSGNPPLHHHSQKRPWRSRTMSVYPLTTPLDLRLAREYFKFGPPKWGHHHWTIGVVSPTRRRPGMRQHKSSVPHLHPHKRGVENPRTNSYRNHFGASVAAVLQQSYVKFVLNTQVENPRYPPFLPTPQENRSPRRLKNKSEVRVYAAVEKSH